MPSEGRRTTLADVAAQAGVSVALVSIVMRDAPGASAATRERVLAVARRLEYQPDSRARLLRSGSSRLLGVVFDVRHAFHGDVVTGLYEAADRVGYELTLSAVTAHRDERAAIAALTQDRCAALVLLGPQVPAAELAALAARMPVVAMLRKVRGRGVDVVRSDETLGQRLAVDHLVELGHQRIAHVDGGRRMVASAERRRGYLEAMGRHGLDAYARVVNGGSGEEDGAHAARELLEDPPTAVTAFNDLNAAGLLDVLRRHGVNVPGDISVVGHDDSALSRLAHVDLTTVAQDVETMTTLALTRAVERIDGTPVALRELVIPPRLVPRGTTSPPAPPKGA
ncbi:LacI family DNA-binding transcriptional regulator [Streptomyces sp. NBC_01190]|uniref:LacI family DNA-binding transcriptional regulator n=1 Tax=Streptomyces sp. NBC_01190 TaxID=2903767 RepID=UPI003864D8DA|nr:LacI family transcriptional regulator [Streptomyces sp. NBC_01190]